MRVRKRYIVGFIVLAGFLYSFRSIVTPAKKVTLYYNARLDSLISTAQILDRVAADTANHDLRQYFFRCRNAYKRVEFLVDVFHAYQARLLNGPDLLRIPEENPGDSIKPHGLQVMEAMLYADTVNRDALREEIQCFVANANRLRDDPESIYYFKDDKIWEGMRLGVYRVISLGVTGFDVPLSNHSLPEARVVLSSIYKTTSFYKKGIGDSLFARGNVLFAQADNYLAANNDFNRFDRMYFIRECINPISVWLGTCANKMGYIDRRQKTPLNPVADHLFAADIINLSFFSPNDKYMVTKERVMLGKRLFYDRQLSGDGSRSCATCHKPELAFTDGMRVPQGIGSDKTLTRNTPTLWNAALQTRQFYDSRTATLENQLSAVVHNVNEMNGSLHNSIPRLLADKGYNAQFMEAYPGSTSYISEYNIANAISCYVRSLISFNSRFDRYMRKETNSFTTAEKNGFNLFMGKAKCGTCHYAPLFNGLTPPLYDDVESEILAVPATDEDHPMLDGDPGKFSFTKVDLHQYAFRTSTVRNSALTAPYMHNGVFKSLDDVVSFYNDGGGVGRGIVLATQTLPADKLNLTKKEMKDIVVFLNTLTDTSGNSFRYIHR